MNTYCFRCINIRTRSIRIVKGYGNTRNEAYNNALEKMHPEYQMID